MKNMDFVTGVAGRANGEETPDGVGIYDPQKQGPMESQTFSKIR